ncbi:MAG: hypothetical protein ACR2GB_05135, partial [Nocardioidaceae bacterium]
VVKGFSLSALLGMSGAQLGCDDAPTTADEQASILDLKFAVEHQYRPFELVAPGFEEIDSSEAVSMRSLTMADRGPVAPFAAIELSVAAADDADVVAGLFSSRGDDSVAVVFSPRRKRVSIEVDRGGDTHVVAEKSVELTVPFQAAFVVCENQVTALADTDAGWRPIVTNRDQVAELIDLRQPDILADLAYGYGAGGSDGEIRLSRVRAGAFGMAGLRDPHLVQRPDGTAYIRDGKAYLTFSCAGLGFFQQAHWGVFTLDLDDPTKLEQVAQLYTKRDGLLLGDHAGQVIVDEPNGQFIVLTSSWGDFDFRGVRVRHVVTSDDVLSGVHLLETARLDLPTEVSSWDPALTRIDDSWHVAFVESPSQDPFDFHPALVAGPTGAAYDENLELIGADTSLHQPEGPILQRVDGQWYLLASDGDQRQYPVYDLSVQLLGTLDAPYGTNIPHPQIVDRPGGGYLMVSFDGTQYGEDVLGYGGHGDVLIMAAKPA